MNWARFKWIEERNVPQVLSREFSRFINLQDDFN